MSSSKRITESLTIIADSLDGAVKRFEYSNAREASQAILNLTSALSNLFYLEGNKEEPNELTKPAPND